MNAHQRRTARRRLKSVYKCAPRPDAITRGGHAIEFKLYPYQQAVLDAMTSGTGCYEIWCMPRLPGRATLARAIKARTIYK